MYLPILSLFKTLDCILKEHFCCILFRGRPLGSCLRDAQMTCTLLSVGGHVKDLIGEKQLHGWISKEQQIFLIAFESFSNSCLIQDGLNYIPARLYDNEHYCHHFTSNKVLYFYFPRVRSYTVVTVHKTHPFSKMRPVKDVSTTRCQQTQNAQDD